MLREKKRGGAASVERERRRRVQEWDGVDPAGAGGGGREQ